MKSVTNSATVIHSTYKSLTYELEIETAGKGCLRHGYGLLRLSTACYAWLRLATTGYGWLSQASSEYVC
jgi:hypothetical protein